MQFPDKHQGFQRGLFRQAKGQDLFSQIRA